MPSIFDTYALAFAVLSDNAARWEHDASLLLSLAETSGSGAGRVLDFACGCGFHARHLALAGFSVTGVDLSEPAIAAGQVLPGGDEVTWRTGDITIPADDPADLVLLLGNTISLLAEEAVLAGVLNASAAALFSGGRLILHSLDYAFLQDHPVRAEQVLEIEGRVATFNKRIDPVDGGGIIAVSLTFEEGGEALEETVALTGWGVPTLTRLTAEAGFTVEHLYGGMDRKPFIAGTTRDRVMVLVKG